VFGVYYSFVLRHSVVCSTFLLAVLSFKYFGERFAVCNILSKL
jgi:hypothetical protein